MLTREITLYQIPISHNCVKVRTALARKGLAFTTINIPPPDRRVVRKVSGQGLVPVLDDGGTIVADSTEILLHLERRYPDPPLLPAAAAARAECLLLEDWADRSFMKLTRRIGYWRVFTRPGGLMQSWDDTARGVGGWVKERVARRVVRRRFGLSAGRNQRDEIEVLRVAAIAMERLGGRPYLIGDAITIADIALAAMAAPLYGASPAVTADAAVAGLLSWIPTILEPADVRMYRRLASISPRGPAA